MTRVVLPPCLPMVPEWFLVALLALAIVGLYLYARKGR